MSNTAHEVLKKGKNRRIAVGTATAVAAAAFGTGLYTAENGSESAPSQDAESVLANVNANLATGKPVRVFTKGIAYIVTVGKSDYRRINLPIELEAGQVVGHDEQTGKNHLYTNTDTQHIKYFENGEQVTAEQALEHSQLIKAKLQENEIVAAPGQGLNNLQKIAQDEVVHPSPHPAVS